MERNQLFFLLESGPSIADILFGGNECEEPSEFVFKVGGLSEVPLYRDAKKSRLCSLDELFSEVPAPKR
jgi:hypothetical protein